MRLLALIIAAPLVLWAGALLGVGLAALALVRVGWDLSRNP